MSIARLIVPAVVAILSLEAGLAGADPLTAKPATGAPPPAPAAPAAPVAPAQPEVTRIFLMDGSVITGRIGLKQFTVETAYGTLSIPVTDVQALKPGLDSHPELGAKIISMIDKLDSADFNERESAQKALTAMGASIRAELGKYLKDPSAERRNRVQAILDDFEQSTGEDSDNAAPEAWSRGDMLTTPQFTVVGRIMPRQFDVVTNYGTLNVKLGDVRNVQRAAEAIHEDVVKTIDVRGQNIANSNFRVTTIRVEKGDQVTLTADGTITLTPWGNQAMCTPEGAGNYGWFVQGQIPMGALVGRVGKDGPIFKVGTKYAFTADRTGVLSFGVGINPDFANNNFPGQYNVKVRVKPHG